MSRNCVYVPLKIPIVGLIALGSYKYEFETGLISTPAVELWNLGVEFSKFELLNSTPKFKNSTTGVEISHFEFRLT